MNSKSVIMALAEFIVMFRESLEVAFVIGIILAYLHKTKNLEYEKHVWLGLAVGVFLTILLAMSFGFSEELFAQSEELFEGVFMIVTALLVTWLVMWIAKQKKVVEALQRDVKTRIAQGSAFGLFMLTTVSVLREGVEAVLFLTGIFLTTETLSLAGALMGMATAIVVGILVFEYAMRFNIGLFFKVTTAVLVLLAAGLFSQGLHKLQEAGVLPVWMEHVYDLGWERTSLLGEKGAAGGILKGLIGYDTNPSDLQVLGYLLYVGAVYAYYKKV